MKVLVRIKRVLYRKPDFYIGGEENPYIRRWWVIPRNRFFNIYLHNQRRDDDDRALHDHPWYNVSIIIKGGYIEHMPVSQRHYPTDYRLRRASRRRGSIIFRRPTDAHRLALHVLDGFPVHSWSLFITGPRLREWGFWCIDKKKGLHRWVSRIDFTDPEDPGKTGKGCEV